MRDGNRRDGDVWKTAARDDATAGLTARGQQRASRAAQFMPFAALTGYYELAREQERVCEDEHELTEEEALALSRAMERIEKGDMVRVTHYLEDERAYRTLTGVVTRIDRIYRELRVVRTTLHFEHIRSIEIVESRSGR